MTREIVSTGAAPAAIGPYSQGVKVNGLLFTAGQVPLDPTTGTLVEGDITTQTERVMRNLEAILQEAGAGFDTVIKTTCFLTDLGDFASFNEVYARFFPHDPPARSTVQVSRLPAGARVEVECVALLR